LFFREPSIKGHADFVDKMQKKPKIANGPVSPCGKKNPAFLNPRPFPRPLIVGLNRV
jgi:hypothetical protein